MRRRAPRAASLGVLVALCAACATVAPAPASVASLPDAKWHVVEHVWSGRYAAELAAVVAEARGVLARRPAGAERVALVLDVDETARSNLPWLRPNDYGWIVGGPCDLARGPCGFVASLELARAEPITPVLELARFARERGMAVFFLTGRPERFRAATEANLKAAGYE